MCLQDLVIDLSRHTLSLRLSGLVDTSRELMSAPLVPCGLSPKTRWALANTLALLESSHANVDIVGGLLPDEVTAFKSALASLGTMHREAKARLHAAALGEEALAEPAVCVFTWTENPVGRWDFESAGAVVA